MSHPSNNSCHNDASSSSAAKADRGHSRVRGRSRGRGAARATAASISPTASRPLHPLSDDHTHEVAGASSNHTSSHSAHHNSPALANGRARGRRGGGRAAGAPHITPLVSSTPYLHQAHHDSAANSPHLAAPRNARRQHFGGKLSSRTTDGDARTNGTASTSTASHPPPPPVDYSDLRSRLVAELTNGSYDCSICYSGISYKAAIWSCSQCHTVLHLSCVKQWASSSVQAAEEQNAMQEDVRIRERKGTWRCPGCQFAREPVPSVYLCWDGQLQDPKPAKKGTVPPHSCGKSCTKSKCPHGCSAGLCHPGPCPPCPVTLHHRCFCGRQDIAVRCSQLSAKSAMNRSTTPSSIGADGGISCGGTCKKDLSCGRHKCALRCHPDNCNACEEDVHVKCYCGKHSKTMKCGQESRRVCVDAHNVWEGSWQCEDTCQRSFDCGIHVCRKGCHPSSSSSPPPCPYSPAIISTCPCGAESRLDRTSCQDPIRTCGNICGRLDPLCEHPCQERCHTGRCPPCSVPVSAPCRCGESRPTLPCHERTDDSEQQDVVLCEIVCRSLRHCGRHECKRRCCPLAFQAKQSRKVGSRARAPTQLELNEQDPARLHACEVPCSKPLSCAKEGHTCPLNCHRGPCPPCLQACFEEVICHCGRTVLEPPVPCGQRPVCRFPCARPPPACGHPKSPHDCHDDGPCPPCVFLTAKECDCGNNLVQNIPCHRTRVSCGSLCGALKPCGFHRCTATCHLGAPEACGKCTALCGKPKRRCGHPCKERCHAPASCEESKPCEEVVTVACPCGHLKQKTLCGAGGTNSASGSQLKCNEACLVAQRNAKLAEALGLDVGEKAAAPPSYEASLLAFYGSDRRFALEMEGILTDFIRSPRHSLILPSASRTQRMFTHELAAVYGLLTESLDLEPKRSVQIRRTQEAKCPRVPPSEIWDKAKRDFEAGLTGGSSMSSSNASVSSGGLRLTSMRSGASTPPSAAFNALLLDGVFGIEEDALRSLLTSAPSPSSLGSALLRLIPFTIKWIGEETVLITSRDPNSNSTSRLLAARPDVTRVLKMNNVIVQTVVSCCFDPTSNRVIRREDRLGGSIVSTTATGGGLAGLGFSAGANTKLTGWAAIAGALPGPTSNSNGSSAHVPPARTNAWGSTSIKGGTTISSTTSTRLASSSTGTFSSSSGSGLNSSSLAAAALTATNWRSSRNENGTNPGSLQPLLRSSTVEGYQSPHHRQQQQQQQQQREETPEEWDADA